MREKVNSDFDISVVTVVCMNPISYIPAFLVEGFCVVQLVDVD